MNGDALVELDRRIRASPASVNAKDKYGNTLAHHACIAGQYNMWNVVRRYAPDLSIKNNAGQTPLKVAVMGRLIKVEEGESNDGIIAPPGLPPLQVAGWEGNVNAARTCLGSVHIDSQDCFGNTALHYASARKMDEFVEFCEKLGANPLIRNNAGQLAMHAFTLGCVSLLPDAAIKA